ncbi:Short-chain dehydrogenase [Flavobacterium sp. 9R]|uniref:SDR family oxidoreductase n=1 Tax=Flavobacterium sp. 9R TaxID=2653143 RepID=UPI0012F3CA24|nr:SDR family oxidoreductase [Flavobacterium sp. 9R]VXB16691.1 Short-chain dehydrogenase [Flavobacterium sp. 9R]
MKVKLLTLVLCGLALSAVFSQTPQQANAPTSKTFLITGASSGFGRATTERLASEGHHIYAGARQMEDLNALGKLANVTPVRLDVNVQAEVDAVVAKIKADGRKLDGLVNNAGVAILFPLNETTEEDLRYVMDANVIGPWRVTKTCAPLLVEAKGRIVNISSISGIFGAPLLGPYSMSKHAVEAYTESLRGEMAKFGVTVCAIEPGNFATGVGQTAFERMKSKGQTYAGSPFEEAAKQNMERLRLPDGKEGPDRVVCAIFAALLDPVPKPRSLVVSNQRDAEVALRSHIRKLAQLNYNQEFSYTREQLIEMLDAAMNEVGAGASRTKKRN